MPLKRYGEQAFVSQQVDFSAGVVGGLTDYKTTPRHLRLCDNMLMRPRRGASARRGSRVVSTGNLPYEPHSIGEYAPSAGTGKVFTVVKDSPTFGRMYEVGLTAFTQQTLPYTPTEKLFSFAQLNFNLFATQRLGTQLPIFFRNESPVNPANTGHSIELPKPSAAPTFAANSAGGSKTIGTVYFYRVRWRYQNGSSLSGPVGTAPVIAAGVQTINISANLVPASPRSDWLGWTLECTKTGGSSVGPFYFVADGTAATYPDGSADADLFYQTDEGLHSVPVHVEGLVAFRDRLFGWEGSNLHVSQTPGDAEATGPCNWDPDLIYPIGRDDGDVIQACLVAGSRLVVVKKRSVHAFEGFDPDSFSTFKLSEGFGIVGPRAACVVGSTVYGFGDRGLWRVDGNTARLIGRTEIQHYLDAMNTAENANSILYNHLSDLMCMAYPSKKNYNNEQLVIDLEFQNWTHFTGWNISDVVEMRGNAFPGVTMLFCDPVNQAAFTGVVATQTVTGSGIPPATTVSTVVSATRITINNAATITATGVTLTVGGVPFANCITTSGSTTVDIGHYHVLSGFDGAKDRRAQDSSGGVKKKLKIQTPPTDDGRPDDLKVYRRIEVHLATKFIETIAATITVEPSGKSFSFTLQPTGLTEIPVGGGDPPRPANWGDVSWGEFNWAGTVTGPTTPDDILPFVVNTLARGLPPGIVGNRYSLTLDADVNDDLVMAGHSMDVAMVPLRRIS